MKHRQALKETPDFNPQILNKHGLQDFSSKENEIFDQYIEEENLNGFLYQLKYCPKTKHLSFPYVSAGIKTIYGIAPEVLQKRAKVILSRLYKEDYIKVQHKIFASMINLTPFSLDFRFVAKNKEIKWSRSQAKPIRLKNGSFVWSGYIKDISAIVNENSVYKVGDQDRNNEILNLVNSIYQNLNTNFEYFNTLYTKVNKTTCLDEKQKIISYLKKISMKFNKEKAYLNEIISLNL